jgi:2-polyprenyl-3-methyl-5-hydroxy-6-metoxy-1,4-benzoquinol methylase
MSLLFEMNRADLISPDYEQEQRILHAAPRGYGGRGRKWAPVVAELVREYSASSVLDYGAGQGTLAIALKQLVPQWTRITEYDPAVERINIVPSFADLVNCTDVLEHIEPAKLRFVLSHLRMLTRKVLWVVVSTTETAKVLSDGRNAHLTVQPAEWWKETVTTVGFTMRQVPAEARQRPDKEWMAALTP